MPMPMLMLVLMWGHISDKRHKRKCLGFKFNGHLICKKRIQDFWDNIDQ